MIEWKQNTVWLALILSLALANGCKEETTQQEKQAVEQTESTEQENLEESSEQIQQTLEEQQS